MHPGDLLVFNDTRVIAARVMGTKPTGGRVEIFLERILADGTALVQLRAGKPIRPGLQIATPGGMVQILGQQQDLWQVRTPAPRWSSSRRMARCRLPPYIQRAAASEDRERYQSIFARDPGAVAAPTASLHFDADLVAALEARGVQRTSSRCMWARGPSSRCAIRTWNGMCCTRSAWSCRPQACAAIADTRRRGGRVIAVGTTVVRALESRRRGALGRRYAAVHPSGFPLPGHRWPADQFPSARVDAADAGVRAGGPRTRAGGLRARRAVALSVLQLW